MPFISYHKIFNFYFNKGRQELVVNVHIVFFFVVLYYICSACKKARCCFSYMLSRKLLSLKLYVVCWYLEIELMRAIPLPCNLTFLCIVVALSYMFTINLYHLCLCKHIMHRCSINWEPLTWKSWSLLLTLYISSEMPAYFINAESW